MNKVNITQKENKKDFNVKIKNNTAENIENKNIYEKRLQILREIPVSINNFFGDPTLQWNDTLEKLNDLVETGHTGAVGMITKGVLDDKKCEELKNFCDKGLKLVIFISISELKTFENVATEHRYENISRLNKFGIKNIAYIRPLIPPYNTTEEAIENMFSKLNKVGAKTAVASGFRGDDSIIEKMSPEEKMQWVLNIKQMEPEVYKNLKEKADKYGLQLFTRTSCAVSSLIGDKHSFNPYYNSPNLVKCEELGCPIINTCKSPKEPKKGSLDFIKELGYDVEFIVPEISEICDIEGENRLKCKSCCTTCYNLKVPHILVKGDVNLGDLTFIRFVSGMLAMQPGRNDDGTKDIAKVTIPKYSQIEGIQCLNTWFTISKIGKKCFDCKYCISDYYKGEEGKNFGFSPARLLEKMNLKCNKILG